MGPRSRSPSNYSRRSYSKSPVKRRKSRRHSFSSGSRSISRNPPSPPPPLTSHRHRHYSISRSTSRSYSPRPRRHISSYSRSRSRSSSEKRLGTREKPLQSRCIGVFGLSVYTKQQKIREIFSKYGPIDRIQVVIDAQTGRSRGFCFIYYEELADAKIAKDSCCGMELDGRRIRVDYSITQRPHTPTPGIYKGRPVSALRDREKESRSTHSRRRTPSPSYSYKHSHSYRGDDRKRSGRSRSRSPRRQRY